MVRKELGVLMLGSILAHTDLPRNRLERLYLRFLGVPNIGLRTRLGLICSIINDKITGLWQILVEQHSLPANSCEFRRA